MILRLLADGKTTKSITMSLLPSLYWWQVTISGFRNQP